MRVIISPTAVGELHGIWQWNAERYGSSHADGYVNGLRGVFTIWLSDMGKGTQ